MGSKVFHACLRSVAPASSPAPFSCCRDKAGPFFIMVYVDDEIIAARGRGGGIGLWQRPSPEWEIKSGSVL